MPTYNEKSSFTAQGLILRRMLWTELPLSREIFEAFEKIHPATPADWQFIKDNPFVPTFEARYLMTDRILAQKGIKQIFELASGLSPRGLVMATDPACTFIEVDLPDEIALKQVVIKNMVDAGAIDALGRNFHLLEGSVTEERVFAKAGEVFHKEQPVAVICEGLLRYLSFDDKAILVRHIHDFLKKFGGVWITPDIELLDNHQRRIHRQAVGMRGIDVEKNIFADMASARKYFEDFGFTVEAAPLAEMVDKCISPGKYGLTPQEVSEVLDERVAFIMTVA